MVYGAVQVPFTITCETFLDALPRRAERRGSTGVPMLTLLVPCR